MQAKELKTTNRTLWADGIRTIAIYFVILAHTVSLPKNYSSWDLAGFSIYGFFGLLSVPLFVILTGSLLLKKNDGYEDFFKKRVKRVLLPWILWSLFYVVFKIINGEEKAMSIWQLAHLSFRVFMSQFWFLPMLFGLYFLTPVLRIFLRNATRRDVAYSILIWLIFIIVVPMVLGAYYITDSYVIQFIGYYLFGYFVIEYPVNKKISKFFLPVFLACFAISPIYYLLLTPRDPTAPSQLFSHVSRIIVIASSSFFIILKDFLQINEPRIPEYVKKLVFNLGQMSLGIYLSHSIFINLYNFIHPDVINNLPRIISIFILSIFVFMFSALLIYLLRKIPLIGEMVG